MPELPDVEAFRGYLDSRALKQRIKRAHVEKPSILRNTSPQGLGRALSGRKLRSTRRHGKLLFAEVEGGNWMVMHFAMTGRLHYSKDAKPPDHTCLRLEMGEHFLDYISQRRLGYVALADSPEAWLKEHELGPDALALERDAFLDMVRGRGGGVKSFLMNQHHIAGIGNVWSDEILFQARIHPLTKCKDLDDKALKSLYQAMREVLCKGIEAGADPSAMPRGFLLRHRAEGDKCPKCSGKVKNLKAAGRSAWICPSCQKK